MWMSITTTMGRCIFMAAITRAQRLRHQVAAEPLLQLHLFSGRPGERRPVRAGRRPRHARIGYAVGKRVRAYVDVYNLFDRKASDIDYFYASRLQGEPAEGVNDVH